MGLRSACAPVRELRAICNPGCMSNVELDVETRCEFALRNAGGWTSAWASESRRGRMAIGRRAGRTHDTKAEHVAWRGW
eukprot:4407720-Prymnesium_polylepis.4